MSMEKLLIGKNALITGSGRGIGKALAIGFAKLGANLILTSRTKQEIDEVKSSIEQVGQKAIAITADVRNYDEIKQVVESGIKEFGKIDILINNAGYSKIKPITKLRVQEFQDMIDINIKGVYNSTHAVTPFMIEKKSGSIINTGSVAINMALPAWSCYAMTKSALTSFTTCLAEELKQFKIRVNTIMPNMVHTPMLHAGRTPEQIQNLKAMQPEELIPYYAFFASDLSEKITGQNINVDLMEDVKKIVNESFNPTQQSDSILNWDLISETLEKKLRLEDFKIVKKNRKLVEFLMQWR